MPVSVGVSFYVGVGHHSCEVERSHKRHSFAHTRRQIVPRQFVQLFGRAASLGLVALAGANTWEDQATCVLERTRADGTAPAAIVPWHADGDVVCRQSARTVCERFHAFPKSTLRRRSMLLVRVGYFSAP